MSAASCSPSFCDKLFDIDEKLNIVPQLALSHETSADGKEVTIKLRPGVKFHDGEPFDAEAAKFSLERHLTLPGSFRKPELAAVDHVEVVDPLTIKLVLKAPFSPLIAQLTDRAGMMVSPKAAKEAGDKFGLQAGLRRALQIRRARAAGPHRGREVRRLLEQGQRLHRPHRLPADRRFHGAARQPEVRRARPDRARCSRPTSRTCAPTRKLKLSTALELGYQGLTHQHRQGQGTRARSASPPRCGRRSSLSIDREAINQVVFNGEFVPGNQWVSPEHPYYQKGFPVPKRDVAKAKALLKEAGVTPPVAVDFMVPKGAENEAVAAGDAVDGGGSRLRPEDPRHRVRDLAQAGARPANIQAFLIGWSGRIDPDGNSYIFHAHRAPQNDGGYSNPEVDKALDDARLVNDRRSARRSTRS